MTLRAQTPRDRKDTRACHSVRALNMKHTLECVFNERYAMLFCSTYKMAAQTQAVGCQFCQLRKWPPALMPERVYSPVRPLVLIYNCMVPVQLLSHKSWGLVVSPKILW